MAFEVYANRLELIAAAQIDWLSNGCAIALQELHGDERVAAGTTLHRLLGNGDFAAFGDERDFPRDFSFMRSSEVVAEDETRVQPGQRERAANSDKRPRVVVAIEHIDVRRGNRRQQKFRRDG